MSDWQDVTQWQGAPLFAGSIAATGVFQDLVTAGALGSYQAMLCYVSTGGACGIQLTFVFSLADTGAGVVTWSRSVYLPPGVSGLFTVPALTNQVRIRARATVNVSADVAIWPTNAYPRYGPTTDGGLIAGGIGVLIPAGGNLNVQLPVWAGVAQFALDSTAAGLILDLIAVNDAGAFINRYLTTAALANRVLMQVVLGLGSNFLTLNNPTAGGITVTWGLTGFLPI